MKARDIVLVGAMCLCFSVAVGSGFYLLSGGPATVIAFVVAIVALALGQTLVFSSHLFQSSKTSDKFAVVNNRLSVRDKSDLDKLRQSEFILKQLEDLRSDANRNADLVAQGFADLKVSYSGLANDLQNVASIKSAPQLEIPQPLERYIPAVEQFTPPPKLEAPRATFVDQLLISLEPIVDLHSGRTAHYRIHVGMISELGTELTHEALLQHADRMGLRTQLDIFIAREAAILLRRLRQRDVTLLMFMPIGAATLASPDALQMLLNDRQISSDVSSGLVLELPHAVLAGLNDQALEGLASLARSGVLLSLSNASISGIDLNALATLNVRYVGLDMGAIGEHGKPNAAVVGFSQSARITRVNLIVTGVTNSQTVASLQQITRLASGPCFAAPRRVKREIASQVSQSFDAAA